MNVVFVSVPFFSSLLILHTFHPMEKLMAKKSAQISHTHTHTHIDYRITSGPEMGAYYHPYFHRDKPHLLPFIHTKDEVAMDRYVTHLLSGDGAFFENRVFFYQRFLSLKQNLNSHTHQHFPLFFSPPSLPSLL